MQLPKGSGGLAFPNFLHYYWAANIQKLLYWTAETTANQPAWVRLEFSSSKASLQSWLCSQLPMSVTDISGNPVVIQSFKIWMQFRKHFSLQHGLIQCKLLHRTYYTNHRLSKFYPNFADACNRCNQSPADIIRMFWSCPKLADFWSKIFDTLHKAYHCVTKPHPLSALFGIPYSNTLTVEAQHSLAFCTLFARRLILLTWKQALPPSYDRWIKEVLYNLKLERLRFSLRGSLRKFDKTWNPLLMSSSFGLTV